MSVQIHTFGCRLNANESEAIRLAAEGAGRERLIVVNTCAVTEEATRKARQTIRRLRRDNPGHEIVVTGCAAQVEPEAFAAMPEVSGVIGNGAKTVPETWAKPFGIAETERVRVDDIMSVRETAGHLIESWQGRARGFVQVQNGCDHRCTFCIIPYGRGPSRSVPMGVVVDQVRRLVENGAGEVVMTGVDLTSYGPDLPGRPTLGKLVRTVLRQVPELPRLRISSIDAVEADDDLLAAIAEEERLMPHLHISLQAGDDLVLKRMKRRHLRADAIAFCDRVRRLRPDIVFGADFIAGFPTETEAQFRNTLDLVGRCGLTHLHVFQYSARRGTPAARMPQVPYEEARERAARLRARGEEALHRHLSGEIGARRAALVETPQTGRTEGFAVVRLARPGKPGDVVPVKIAGHDGKNLLAA